MIMAMVNIINELVQYFNISYLHNIENYFRELFNIPVEANLNSRLILIFICVTLCFIVLSVSFLIFIYINRIKRERRNKKIKEKKFTFQLLLYEALVENEGNNIKNLNESIIEKFKAHGLKSKISQQVLVDLIISLKKNFTGQSEDQLLHLYHDLRLYELSIKKLKSSAWDIQVEGIRELAEMRYQKAWLEISRLRHSRKPILAQEAQIASIKLAEKVPLYFLDNYLKGLSNWQQISFYHQLLNTDKNLLPDFSRWLLSGNESLIVFSLKMIGLFSQQEALEKVVSLLDHKSLVVKYYVVQTLVKLKAVRHVNRLFNLLDIDNIAIKICVIKAIGQLGNHYHKLTLKPFLLHENYHIRLATAKAIKGINVKNLSSNSAEMNKQIEVLNHVADPFL